MYIFKCLIYVFTLCFCSLISAQIYIDPTVKTNGIGTILKPHNKLPTFIKNTTYLFKRGTIYYNQIGIRVNVMGITFGAYGSGTTPIIQQPTSNNNIWANSDVGNLTIQDLELYSFNSEEYNISFMYASGDINILNCKIHGGSMGIRLLYCPTVNLKVIGCEIYNVLSDGMFIHTVNSFEAGNNTIYNVNACHPNNPDDGDNIHMDDIPTIWIHHNTLDHTSQPGKFCVLVGATTSSFVGNAIIENNIMRRQRTGNDNTVFYSNYAHGSQIIFRYNKVQDALVGIQSRTYDMQVYYNTFSNLGQVMELSAPGDFASYPKIYNNTIYNCGQVIYGCGEIADFKNNIVHTVTGTAFDVCNNLTLDYNDYFNVPAFGNSDKGVNDITADPLFNNISVSDFTPKNSLVLGRGAVQSILPTKIDTVKILTGKILQYIDTLKSLRRTIQDARVILNKY